MSLISQLYCNVIFRIDQNNGNINRFWCRHVRMAKVKVLGIGVGKMLVARVVETPPTSLTNCFRSAKQCKQVRG